MRRVTYSMAVSLDGYIAGPDGQFDWSVPGEEVFRFATDETRRATLAVEAASLGLIDEYRARIYPVLVGGGIPFFPSTSAGWISNSSRPAPSAPKSSTSATA